MSKSRREYQIEKQKQKKAIERLRRKRYNKERAEAEIMLQVYAILGYVSVQF